MGIGLLLLPGGITGWELAFGALLLIAGARGSAVRDPSPSPPAWLEGLLVIGAAALFLWLVLRVPVGDEPMGDGWMRYLRNAHVFDTGQWQQWQRWRAPGHAWLMRLLTPLAGSLTGAARWVGVGSTAALLPLTWWLTRGTLGRWPALLGLGVLLSWADLRALALQTTPYAVLAACIVGGAAFVAVALRGRAAWAIGAGLLMGLGWGSDLRGAALTACLVVLALVAGLHPSVQRRGPLVGLIVAVIAVPLAWGILHSIPVDLYPLSRQIVLQRDFNAASAGGDCLDTVGRLPAISDLWGACAQKTLSTNLGHLQAWFPISPFALGALGLVGLVSRGGAPWWGRLLIVGMVLPGLPTPVLVPFFHRYGLAVAPFAAALAGGGLWALAGRAGPRLGPVLGLGVVAVLGAGWQAMDSTLIARVEGRGGEGLGPTGVAVNSEMNRLVGWLRAEAAPEDQIVDCVQAGLSLRLAPREVTEPPKPVMVRVCQPIFATPPTERTWLLAPAMALPILEEAGWRRVERFDVARGSWLMVGG